MNIEHNLIMVTYEFGYPLYVAPMGELTEVKEDAERWCKFDSTKLDYWRQLTGFKNLKFESL